MKLTTLVAAARLTVACLCVVLAFLLAYYDKNGWGWFLFVGLWLGCITASEKPDSTEDK